MMEKGGTTLSILHHEHEEDTRRARTDSRYMAQLVPPNRKQLEGIDEVAHDGHVPEAENDNGHCDHLREQGDNVITFRGLGERGGNTTAYNV